MEWGRLQHRRRRIGVRVLVRTPSEDVSLTVTLAVPRPRETLVMTARFTSACPL